MIYINEKKRIMLTDDKELELISEVFEFLAATKLKGHKTRVTAPNINSKSGYARYASSDGGILEMRIIKEGLSDTYVDIWMCSMKKYTEWSRRDMLAVADELRSLCNGDQMVIELGTLDEVSEETAAKAYMRAYDISLCVNDDVCSYAKYVYDAVNNLQKDAEKTDTVFKLIELWEYIHSKGACDRTTEQCRTISKAIWIAMGLSRS